MRPGEDDQFIDCALAGQADIVVSGDRDLLALGETFGIKILSARALRSGNWIFPPSDPRRPRPGSWAYFGAEE